MAFAEEMHEETLATDNERNFPGKRCEINSCTSYGTCSRAIALFENSDGAR